MRALLATLLTSAILGLVGWVYSTSNRVTAVEVRQEAAGKTLQEIHEDVRELRRVLIGP